MRRITRTGLMLGIFAWHATAQKPESPDALLGAAIHLEEAEGDVEGAIAAYKKLLSQFGGNRQVAARAQYRLAQSYERLKRPEARDAFERVLRDYADQPEAAQARRRLAVLPAPRPADALTARRLLTVENMDFSDITPDGVHMGVTDWVNGDIAIRDVSTGRSQRLMAQPGSWEGGAHAESPVFSHDMKQVAYIWYDGTEYDKNELRVMPNEPGAKSRVVLQNPEFAYVEPKAWSPDGKSILAIIWNKDGTGQIGWVSAANGRLSVLKSLEWRGPGNVRLSPDGRYIAYTARPTTDSKDVHIYLLAADGSSETALIRTEGTNKDPRWTPDGNHILFTSDRSGAFGLWAVSVAAGKAAGAPMLVKPDTGWIGTLGWTRSGSLYYLHGRSDENVFVADIDPESGRLLGAGARLTEKFVGYNRVPAWSPDGRFIAFKRLNPASNPWATIGYDLVVRSLETGEEKTYNHKLFVNGMGAAQRPQWFADGESILVDMLTNLGASFHRVDLRTGEFKEVVSPFRALSTRAALSPDGRTLYATAALDPENKTRIIAFDLATGEERHSFLVEGRVPGIAVSPDGRTVVLRQRLVRRAGKNVGLLARIATDGSDYRELHTMANDVGLEELAWTRDGQAILFGAEVMKIPAAGGRPEAIGLTLDRRHNLDLSRDGSRIAFSNGNTAIAELWALDHILPTLNKTR